MDETTEPITLGEGEAALHYAGEHTLVRDGLTFAPDSITVLPEVVAARLAGRDNLRLVADLDFFLTQRARRGG